MREGFFLQPVWPLCFQTNKADAVTLDAGLVYEAGLDPYKLRPVAAEVYGTEERESSLGTRSWGGPGLVQSEWLNGRGRVSDSFTLAGDRITVLCVRG